MANFGSILLIVALLVSIFTVIAYLIGFRQRNIALISFGRTGATVIFALITLAFATLGVALLTHHFEIVYVAEYSSLNSSFPYLISALWAGNAGSLFFWGWILSMCGSLVAWQGSKGDKQLNNYASTILTLLVIFFLLLLIFAVNPFRAQTTVPTDGAGLNPLLQNPAMIIHPPILLSGYVLFAVPFAFAAAALLTNKMDDLWITKSRSWALLGWLALGIGNLIGAWWAYVELGWGGYWAWDPVENAGLMPWLAGTALLHSFIMHKRRGMFKMWSMFLVLVTFWLTIFGTFLTRSNLLSSVHTFGKTGIEPYFLTLLAIILGAGTYLLVKKRDFLENKQEIESAISREGIFFLNNLLLLASTFAIFLATMLPAIAKLFSAQEFTINQSFFNIINVPLFISIVLLAGFCVIIGWRRFVARDFGWKIIISSTASMLIVVGLFLAGFKTWHALVIFFLCIFAILATGAQWVYDLIRRKTIDDTNANYSRKTRFWASKNRYGAYIVHIAIALISVGVIGSSLFDVEKTVSLNPGESTQIKKYNLTYNNLDIISVNSTKMAVIANISVAKNGVALVNLAPEQDYYTTQTQSVTEVAIHSTLGEDLYVVLSSWNQSKAISLHILVNPLVMLLWIGSGVLLLGGLVCFWPQPYTAGNLAPSEIAVPLRANIYLEKKKPGPANKPR